MSLKDVVTAPSPFLIGLLVPPPSPSSSSPPLCSNAGSHSTMGASATAGHHVDYLTAELFSGGDDEMNAEGVSDNNCCLYIVYKIRLRRHVYQVYITPHKMN
jgi:hypothetical protein